MSEGGLFAWKHQRVDHRRGPAGSYRNLQRPLPDPPKDMHWIQDLDTKEWQLTQIVVSYDDGTGIDIDIDIDGSNTGIKEAVGVADTDHLPRVVQHTVQHDTDTFQGICLKYKITPTELRRANGGFSGTNLHLAPNPLQIPINAQYLEKEEMMSSKKHLSTATTSTPAQSIRRLQLELPSLSNSEAKCYLELNDWNLVAAMENARDDGF
jgi:hypothetical protein